MGLDLAVANAVAHWLAMARASGWETEVRPGWTAVRATDGHRVLVTARPEDPEALTGELLALFRAWETRQLTLEDPYLALDLSPYGCESALPMPVMVRDPVPVVSPVAPSSGLLRPGTGEEHEVPQMPEAPEAREAREAVDEEDLAVVERVVVEGFPVPHLLPWRRAGHFPVEYARIPGRRSWLARIGDEPAAACVTMDDGSAVGVYWVATLPEFRSRGAAGAVLRTALAAHPDRPATLTATLLGEPLYRRLGFTERAAARWWRYPSTPAALRR